MFLKVCFPYCWVLCVLWFISLRNENCLLFFCLSSEGYGDSSAKHVGRRMIKMQRLCNFMACFRMLIEQNELRKHAIEEQHNPNFLPAWREISSCVERMVERKGDTSWVNCKHWHPTPCRAMVAQAPTKSSMRGWAPPIFHSWVGFVWAHWCSRKAPKSPLQL